MGLQVAMCERVDGGSAIAGQCEVFNVRSFDLQLLMSESEDWRVHRLRGKTLQHSYCFLYAEKLYLKSDIAVILLSVQKFVTE